ncbi:MAG: replicative DNA helicase [Armatimonadetes bacterium]|nr:replicative DNA helicase [Armatimonadota bacterium]
MAVAREILIPLHSMDAEMSALGSMMYGERPAEQVFAALGEDDWYVPAHRELFRAMLQLQRENKAIDLVTLKQELSRRGRLEEVGGEDYLIRVMQAVPSPANASYYARIVVDNATMRRLEDSAHQIVKMVRDPELEVDDKVSAAEQAVFQVGAKRLGKDFLPMRQLATEVMTDIDTILDTGEETLGVPSGFVDLDDLTTGFYGGDLVIIAARPSMGKTGLVLRTALKVASSTGPVAFFSLEMGGKQLARRLVSMLSKVSAHTMKKPNLDHGTLKKLADACETLYGLPLYVDETSECSPLQMMGKCRRLKREHGLSMVVVDYLQLMHGVKRTENRVQEISEISRSLKTLAKELDVPVIALSQLSRAVENRDKRIPQLSDLRESGSIEADADIVLLLYREMHYNERDPKWLEEHPDRDMSPDRVEVANLIVAKHRNGPTGIVDLAFQPTYALFSDLKR